MREVIKVTGVRVMLTRVSRALIRETCCLRLLVVSCSVDIKI